MANKTVYVWTNQGGESELVDYSEVDDIQDHEWEEVELDPEEVGDTPIISYYEFDGYGKITYDPERLEGSIEQEVNRIDDILFGL